MSAAVVALPPAATSARHKRPPPPQEWESLPRRIRRSFFATPTDAFLSLIAIVLIAYAAPVVIRWAFLDSVVVADTAAVCQAATGACWAVISRHLRVIVFGLYPYDEQWRALWALLLVVAASAATVRIGLWRVRPMMAIWTATLAGFVALMGGGVAGLSPVPADRWGGLPLTLYVFLGTVVLGFPLAIALALGRASNMRVIRWFCTTLIETVRAVPLLTVLFCAAVVVPLLLPGFLNPAKLNRVIVSMAVFYACYQAEVIRGGFQGVPRAQVEAALSLGLGRLRTMWLVVLPQALRITIPATVNLLVVAFKDTSMVIIVGLFDFLAAANTAFSADAWQPFFAEVYVLVALVYLVATGVLSWMGRRFERRLARHG